MIQVKKRTKVVGLLLLGLALFIGIRYLDSTGRLDFLKQKSSDKKSVNSGYSQKRESKSGDLPLIRFSTTAWVGHAAGPYANRGFRPNDSSKFAQRGFEVKFLHNDDPVSTKDNFVNGDCDMMWFTVDALPSILDKNSDLARVNPVVFSLIDRSDGGDALVVGPNIKSLNDLRGKRIAFAERTPSHSLVIQALSAAGLTMNDIIQIKCSDPIQAGEMLRTRKSDASAVWSPDDAALRKEIRGAKILYSSKLAPYAIMDIILVKRSLLEDNHGISVAFLEEWYKSAGEIENNDIPSVRNEVLNILSDGYQGYERSFFEETYYNAQRSTYGDNLNFFGLNPDFTGVTGEELYTKMARAYKELGVVKDPVPWRSLLYLDVLKDVNLTPTGWNAPEKQVQSAKVSEKTKTAEAISTKSVSVSFPTGSAVLDDNAKWIIDNAFVFEAKTTSLAIRVGGHTDNTGNYNSNMRLSELRAKAVVDYLISQHGLQRGRFIAVGYGPKKALEDGVYGDSQKYRVTTFELVSE